MVEMNDDVVKELIRSFGSCEDGEIKKEEIDGIKIYGPFYNVNERLYLGIESGENTTRAYIISADFRNIHVVQLNPDGRIAKLIKINNPYGIEFLEKLRPELAKIGAYRALKVMARYISEDRSKSI